MSFFENFDWNRVVKGFTSGVANSIVPAALSYTAGREVRKGNEAAGRIAAQADQNQLDILERIRRQTQAEGAPAISHYRATLAERPEVLTPAQNINLGDAQRSLQNQNLIGRAGGRAYGRVHADVTNRFRAGATSENIRRQDAAAGQLMRRGDMALATQAKQGQVISDAGGTQANIAAATGENEANTMAAIGSYFANAVKDADRAQRYREYETQTGRL